MKKALLPPLAVLAAILAFALWNGAFVANRTAGWQAQLQQAAALADSDNWSAAEAALTASHDGWTRCQTYLHIVLEHDAVDDAEAMYHRALAFAAARESSEFQAEIADLLDQLRLLAEMEEFSIQNVL